VRRAARSGRREGRKLSISPASRRVTSPRERDQRSRRDALEVTSPA
jgi:hypothetical protein